MLKDGRRRRRRKETSLGGGVSECAEGVLVRAFIHPHTPSLGFSGGDRGEGGVKTHLYALITGVEGEQEEEEEEDKRML